MSGRRRDRLACVLALLLRMSSWVETLERSSVLISFRLPNAANVPCLDRQMHGYIRPGSHVNASNEYKRSPLIVCPVLLDSAPPYTLLSPACAGSEGFGGCRMSSLALCALLHSGVRRMRAVVTSRVDKHAQAVRLGSSCCWHAVHLRGGRGGKSMARSGPAESASSLEDEWEGDGERDDLEALLAQAEEHDSLHTQRRVDSGNPDASADAGETFAEGLISSGAAQPHDEDAMLRQMEKMEKRHAERQGLDPCDSEEDSWRADEPFGRGLHARSRHGNTQAPADPDRNAGGLISGTQRFRHSFQAQSDVDHEGAGERDVSLCSENFEEDSEVDEDELLLSPVSRYQRAISKLKWNWYDADERKPDHAGWTELDRRLRLNIAPSTCLKGDVLMVLGGYTGPFVGMTVLRDCERLGSVEAPAFIRSAHTSSLGGVGAEHGSGGAAEAATDRWWGMPALKQPRSACAAAASDDAIYVLGGQANDASNKRQGGADYKKYVELASVERLRLRPHLSRRWECGVVPDMLNTRVGHAAVVLNGRLYG